LIRIAVYHGGIGRPAGGSAGRLHLSASTVLEITSTPGYNVTAVPMVQRYS
jgi:hypothetical protein